MSLLQPCEIKLTVQHDPLPPGFMEITLNKTEGEKLGMIVKGGLRGQPGNPLDPADEGVFCVKVNTGSIASKDSRIKVGQRIIEVNGQSLLGATHQEAVNILRNLAMKLNFWSAMDLIRCLFLSLKFQWQKL